MRKRWTGEMVREFVEGEGYILVSVPNEDWVKGKDRIWASCGEHESYEVSWGNFYSNKRCSKCSKNYKWSHKEICEEVKKIDENYFVCEDSKKYENAHTKLKISCNHNHVNIMSWASFKRGSRCKKCQNRYRWNHEEICKEVPRIDRRYSICSDSPIYINAHTKLKLSCHKKHTFMTIFSNFRNGSRCPECSKEDMSNKLSFSHEEMYEKVKEVDSEYILEENSPIYKNCKTKIKIKHLVCNNSFLVTWTHFRKGSKPCGCYSNSKNEVLIREYLKSKNIKFSEQVTFDGLKSKNKLRYDFGIYENDKLLFLLEYDGEQHFKAKTFGGISQEQAEENLIKTQHHDKLKNDYARKNNIPLLRIRYDEDTISVLENYLKDLQLIKEDGIINLTKKRSDTYD